jgi:glycosyltransferase involved in cell wall biosynthesis
MNTLGSRKLHIHVIDELKTGGAQTHLVTILRESLARYQFEHRVVSLFGDGPIGDQIRDLGVPTDVFEFREYFERKRFLAVGHVLEDLFRQHRPELVEAHLTWSRLLGLYGAWKAGVPLRIGFEHGDLYFNSWKFRTANFVGQNYAHRIVVCSQALADWARRTHGISRKKLVVLHNCVDLERFVPRENASLRRSWGFPGEPTVFAAVGTLGSGVNKRVDVTIRAIAEARSCGGDVALVVCGDGDQRTALEAQARDLGIQDAVRFLGMRGDVPDVLAACDVFCHAAPFEPFGIVCIEAMAMGIPVVVPDSGGIKEAVEPGTTGLVYPALDTSALAARMMHLVRNPQKARTMGLAGRRAAEQRFSVQTYVQRLYAMYGVDSLSPIESIST